MKYTLKYDDDGSVRRSTEVRQGDPTIPLKGKWLAMAQALGISPVKPADTTWNEFKASVERQYSESALAGSNPREALGQRRVANSVDRWELDAREGRRPRREMDPQEGHGQRQEVDARQVNGEISATRSLNDLCAVVEGNGMAAVGPGTHCSFTS